MAVAIGGDRELDGDERLLLPLVEQAMGTKRGLLARWARVLLLAEDVVNHVLVDEAAEKVSNDDPLVVPANGLLRLLEDVVVAESRMIVSNAITFLLSATILGLKLKHG